jgi:fructokinase
VRGRGRVGGVEAGGTKWVCAVGTGPSDLSVSTFPTTTPAETIGRVVSFFRDAGRVEAVGIGCFGPVDLARGRITTTPKAGWAGTDVAAPVAAALGVPVAFETDVGAAAVGEWRWGAAQGRSTFVYVTVGTGIGGTAVVDGVVLHGVGHAEMGHQRVPHALDADPFPGACPYHGDCWEGLASGSAIAARWGSPGDGLPADHPAWALEAGYVAAGLANIALVLAPGLVIVGGGVGSRPGLLDRVRAELTRLLAGYVSPPEVVPAALGAHAGVLGALALALDLDLGPTAG